jgi:cobaltochelatase CobS
VWQGKENDIMKFKQYSVGELFGVVANDSLTTLGYEFEDKYAPELAPVMEYLQSKIPQTSPHYQFRRELLVDWMLWANHSQKVLYLWGPTQSGKTSLVKEIYARLKVPVFELTVGKETHVSALFGDYFPESNGTLQFRYGPMVEAARYGGVLLINEFDRLKRDRAVTLNDAFSGAPFAIIGRESEIVRPQPGYRVILTGNTNLLGDTTGGYATASQHDVSVMERLFSIHCPYPSRDVDEKVVASVIEKVSDDMLAYWFDQEGIRVKVDNVIRTGQQVSRAAFISACVDFAHAIRERSADGGNPGDEALERTMSLGSLREWVRMAVLLRALPAEKNLSALHYALRKVVSELATESSRVFLHEMVKTHFGVNEVLPEPKP